MGNSYVRQLKKVGVWRGGVRGWGVGGGGWGLRRKGFCVGAWLCIRSVPVVRMTAVVFGSFSLLPHGCSCSVAPRRQCCLLVPLQSVCVGGGDGWEWGGGGGRTVENALGTVVLSGLSTERAEL